MITVLKSFIELQPALLLSELLLKLVSDFSFNVCTNVSRISFVSKSLLYKTLFKRLTVFFQHLKIIVLHVFRAPPLLNAYRSVFYILKIFTFFLLFFTTISFNVYNSTENFLLMLSVFIKDRKKKSLLW